MTISYQMTRRDYVDAFIAMSRKTYWCLLGLWLLLAILSAWMDGSEMLRGSASQRVAAFFPIVSCGLFFLLFAWIGPRYRARRMILREVTWTFGDEGVHLAWSVGTTDLRWEAFLNYRETQRVFLLFVQRGMGQFIPKRVLTTEQADDLRMLLGNHIKPSLT